MGLGGSKRIVWKIYGRNWREDKRVSGFTVISICKIQIKKKCSKDEFYNESTSGHWCKKGCPPTMPPPQSWGSFELSHASQLAICSWALHSSLDTKAPIWHSWSRHLFNVAARFLHAKGLCHTSPLSDSVFSTFLSYKKKKKEKENWKFNLGESFVLAFSAVT